VAGTCECGNVSDKSVKKYILCSKTFLKIVEKHSRAGKVTYDNIAHAHCMLDA
jgi:hypothetical protein